jgi:NAD(P)-dependent dehydrogenase (short-subunit alcohol dehydrogenase family)
VSQAESSRRMAPHLSSPCDVTDLAAVKECAAGIEGTHGPIDIVIANAGTYVASGPHESFDSAEYESIMRLNYGGMIHTIESVLPAMLERKRGHIVGVSSLVGYRGLPRAAAYGASKAAAINFLESLRFHTAPRGVPVTIVNPGFVKTPLTDKNDFEMPFLVPAEEAARIICRGIEKQKMGNTLSRCLFVVLQTSSRASLSNLPLVDFAKGRTMNRERLKIAIVGGGVAGIVSSYLLSQNHDVTLFEKNNYVGGHTATIVLEDRPRRRPRGGHWIHRLQRPHVSELSQIPEIARRAVAF